MWSLMLSASEDLAVDGSLITTSPQIELVVVFTKCILPESGLLRTITEEKRSHESTLEEFLPTIESSTASQTFMSTVLVARFEADADLFSRMQLGPATMHYAEAAARRAVSTPTESLLKLPVEADVYDVTPDFITRSSLNSQLDLVYRLTSVAALVHELRMRPVEWADGDGDDLCAMCFDDFVSGEKLTRLSCDYVFHACCIFKWLFRQGNCPICRSFSTVDLDSLQY